MNRLKNFFSGHKNETKDKEETNNTNTTDNTTQQTNQNTSANTTTHSNSSGTATDPNLRNFLNRNVIEHHPGLQHPSNTSTNANTNITNNNNNMNTMTTTTADDKGTTTTTTTTGLKDDGKTIVQAKLEEHCENGVVTETIDVVSMTLPTKIAGNLYSDTNIDKSKIDMTSTKDHLEHLLEKKKDREELVEQGIIETQPHKKELERHMAENKVEKELRRRHSKEELTQSGVLKEGMQSAKHALEQEKIKDKLNHKLADRPSQDELLAHHILETQETMAAKRQRRASAAEVMTEQIQKFKDQKLVS